MVVHSGKYRDSFQEGEKYDFEGQYPSRSRKLGVHSFLKKLTFIILLIYLPYFAYSIFYHPSTSGVNLVLEDTELTANEAAYLKAISEENLSGNWSKKYTEVPHLPGKGLGLVNFTAEKFMEYGLETEIETFDIYMNYPVDTGLTLYEEGIPVYKANLTEDVLQEDPTTAGDDLIPAFHAYSASGNVTAQYVYVNYGTKEDFDLLKDIGVSVKGKIVIVRYGAIFRGLKVKFAQEAGAVGVLIYSDPGDDEFQEANGDKPYPLGPARNPSSLQRGSVQFLSIGPGDPTTPGRPSQGDDVVREDPYKTIPKIPSLPISFREVEPILKELNGFGLKASKFGGEKWIGNLPGFNYWTGPNPAATLNLYNEQKYDIVPIHNVYGVLRGENDDSFIMIGNHRDAMVKGGAGDPNSGSAAMLEIVRGFHQLSLTGWKPYRTIKFASWDGEEYGLLGSTEYGEKNAKYLQSSLLAYLNVDTAVSGKLLNVESSPFLNKAINEALRLVEYPSNEHLSLHDHYYNRKEKIGILGSGSDYTVFLEHLGIPSMDISFGAGKGDAVYHYHSNYDSYHWMSTVQDPGFKFHQTMSKILGMIALRLSEPKVVNTKIENYCNELIDYFQALSAKVPKHWMNVTDHKGLPLSSLIEKTTAKLEDFKTNAIGYDSYLTDLREQWENLPSLPFWKRIALRFKIKGANMKLMFFERSFIHEDGLKMRPWFKHIVYAAGRNTGYLGFALPGLKEALDDNEVEDFMHWAHVFSHTVNNLKKSYKQK